MSDSMKSAPAPIRTAVTPYLCIKGAADAIAFYERAFGAVEIMRVMDGEKVGHAEIRIGDTPIYLADEYPELDFLSPASFGGSPVQMHLLVRDVDTAVERAVAAGATLVGPVADQLHGDRCGRLTDPFGYRWTLATPIERLSAAEIERRYSEAAESA